MRNWQTVLKILSVRKELITFQNIPYSVYTTMIKEDVSPSLSAAVLVTILASDRKTKTGMSLPWLSGKNVFLMMKLLCCWQICTGNSSPVTIAGVERAQA